jgi:hypothetical protein
MGFQAMYAFIIWLSTYFPGLDIVLSLIFIYLIFWAGRLIAMESLDVIKAGLLSQIPGLIFTVLVFDSFFATHLLPAESVYLLLWWYGPFFPWLSRLSISVLGGLQLYFLALFTLAGVYILLLSLGGCCSGKGGIKLWNGTYNTCSSGL